MKSDSSSWLLRWLASEGTATWSGVATLACTFIVIIGLGFEIAAAIEPRRWPHSDDWSPWTGAPEPEYWTKETIGDWLVMFGVAGELLFGVIAFSSAYIRDTAQRLEIARLNTRNLQLEVLLKPRRVNNVMIDSVALQGLLDLHGTKVAVLTVPDLEAVRFARDIVGIFQYAHWDVVQFDVASLKDSLDIPDGFWWRDRQDDLGHEPDRLGQSVFMAVSAFNDFTTEEAREPEIGFNFIPPNAKWMPASFNPPSDSFIIVVGMKPIEDELSDMDFIDANERMREDWLQRFENAPLPTFIDDATRRRNNSTR